MDGTDSPDVPMDFKHVFLIGKAYRERSRRALSPILKTYLTLVAGFLTLIPLELRPMRDIFCFKSFFDGNAETSKMFVILLYRFINCC